MSGDGDTLCFFYYYEGLEVVALFCISIVLKDHPQNRFQCVHQLHSRDSKQKYIPDAASLAKTEYFPYSWHLASFPSLSRKYSGLSPFTRATLYRCRHNDFIALLNRFERSNLLHAVSSIYSLWSTLTQGT
jgi:hypothetical protein